MDLGPAAELIGKGGLALFAALVYLEIRLVRKSMHDLRNDITRYFFQKSVEEQDD